MTKPREVLAVAYLGIDCNIKKPRELYTPESGLSYEDMGTVRNHIRRVWH